MSNNKRRILFSVRVHLEHRKISIHQWEDHSSQTKYMCTFKNTNWRHPQKYQQPTESSYLLILLFQVPPIASCSFKRYKQKKKNQKPQPIPTPLPTPKSPTQIKCVWPPPKRLFKEFLFWISALPKLEIRTNGGTLQTVKSTNQEPCETSLNFK